MQNTSLMNRLAIGTRRTYGADGAVDRRETVLCPSRGTSIETDECYDCDQYLGPSADEPALLCLNPSGHASRATRLPSVSVLMTRDVECVRQDLSLESLVTLLVEHDIGSVPVLDQTGRPIGVASKTDVVRWLYENDSTDHTAELVAGEEIEPGSSVRAIPKTTVADVMMPLAFTLSEDAPISFAAAMMAVENVHHLPIVGADGQVVGIVTSLDLVRWMAEQEGFPVR